MRWMKRTFIVVIVLACGCIHAEGGCPEGEYPQQGPGWRTCVPIPGAASGDRQLTYRWKNNWGAIAADTATASLGATTTAPSENEAKLAAVADCKAKGGSTCEVLITVRNACMAMVVGASRLHVKGGSTKTDAEGKSMTSCNDQDKNCTLYYSACSAPEKVMN